MRVCVLGLWHLGTVTAACLAARGHLVTGLDFDDGVVAQLQSGNPPLFEPDLEDVVRDGLARDQLRFTTDVATAVAGADVVWVAYDTPVDSEDRADVGFVLERAARLFPHLEQGTLVLISSQLPVGSTRRLEQEYAEAYPNHRVSFAYSPENLRLGKAISAFTQPDRVVVGVRSAGDRERVMALMRPFTERIEWMSVESAEMTKHALNAFLATSIAFINEIASICEAVGADAKEVERGLKSEPRIGPKAYLAPGVPFAGGTLARDIGFLTQVGRSHQQPVAVLTAVKASNDEHKKWARRKLQAVFGALEGRSIAIWGLTYKPGTDTLRGSASLELCDWLLSQGAYVHAHDPVVRELPAAIAGNVLLCSTALEAASGADAVVVATEWPDYRSIEPDALISHMRSPWVLDANRFLCSTLEMDTRFRYFCVGKATS